jgi:tRNA dimethylallyltransferase
MATAEKTVIIIAGPTAVGKTSVAIDVAKYYQTEIISADSRQCYKELNIGVARPSEEELKEVKHHFIASHSIHEKITAAAFEDYALEKAAGIFQKHNVVIMVGGTGLYIKAFCEGMDAIPEVPERIRNEIVSLYQRQGLQWLQEEVQKLDPKFYAAAEVKNPQRLIRALEVFKATGRSVLDFRKGEKTKREFSMVPVALQLPKEQIHSNIEHRVDKMMGAGLLEEVRSLIPYQHLNALQTVGYKELFSYFNGETGRADAVELIKRNTKQYAKRQMTWFRKDKNYCWMEPDAGKVIEFLKNTM